MSSGLLLIQINPDYLKMNNPDGDPSSDITGDFLPNDYEYNILSCQVQNASDKGLQLDLRGRIDVKSEAEVKWYLLNYNVVEVALENTINISD